MTLPNVSQAIQKVQLSSGCDVSKLESLKLVAPLPSHMQRSWDVLNSWATSISHRSPHKISLLSLLDFLNVMLMWGSKLGYLK